MSSHDREIVETLYLSGDIRVLVATATLAWGVNLPARLVIVKGTEYFDGKVSRYVDYPLTDVLQVRLSRVFLFLHRLLKRSILLIPLGVFYFCFSRQLADDWTRWKTRIRH